MYSLQPPINVIAEIKSYIIQEENLLLTREKFMVKALIIKLEIQASKIC